MIYWISGFSSRRATAETKTAVQRRLCLGFVERRSSRVSSSPRRSPRGRRGSRERRRNHRFDYTTTLALVNAYYTPASRSSPPPRVSKPPRRVRVEIHARRPPRREFAHESSRDRRERQSDVLMPERVDDVFVRARATDAVAARRLHAPHDALPRRSRKRGRFRPPYPENLMTRS